MKKSTIVLILLLLGHALVYGQEPLSSHRAERLFQSGVDLMSHREYGPAYKSFDELLGLPIASDSRRMDAQYYRALCSLQLYHADAEGQLQGFIEKNPRYPKAMSAYFDLGNFFYGEKNYARSSTYYSKVDFRVLSDEQKNTGRFRWGYSLFTLRSLKESLDQFNVIKAQGGTYGPASSYYAGFIESSIGDFSNALIDLQRAEANSAYASIVPVLITYIYYKQKADDMLLSYAESALTRENLASADEISLLAAETYYRKSNYAKALPLYSAYLDEHEKSADRGVMFRAGATAFNLKESTLALQYLQRSALEQDSIGTNSSYLLGLLYLQRKEKPQALAAFENVKNSTLDARLSEESLFFSAKINYELGRPDVSIEEFENLLKRYPQSSHGQETRELLSQAYVNANNFNKAIEYMEGMGKRTPAVDRAYQKATLLKGMDQFNKEEYASAVQLFEKSLLYPLDESLASEAAFWCGESYSIGRKYEQAIPYYLQALGSKEDFDLNRRIRYGLGYAYYNLQQYDQALLSFREFVNRSTAKEATYTDGLIRLADCYYVKKSYHEALASYRKAVQLMSPDADYAHLQEGMILVVDRHYVEAAAEFDKVVANTSSRYAEEALFQLAQLDFEQSNYTSAVNRYSQLIATAKSSRWTPFALTRRAAAYYNLKKYDLTANDYIEVLEKYPGHPAAQDLLLPLQESLNLANRSSEFDKYLAQFKISNPDASGIEAIEFESAKSLYFNQSYPAAIDKLSWYAANYPDSPRVPEAKYYQAESYYRIKDYAKALELYNNLSRETGFSFITKTVTRQAELESRAGHYDNAVLAFRRLQQLAGNKKEENTAWNGLMETYYLLAQYDSADVYAHKLIDQGNINIGSQNKASLYMGKSAMARGDYETAKDEFLTTLNAAHDEYGAEAKYLLAEIFFLNKETTQCQETLMALISDFPTYTDWIGKSFLLLADNYASIGEIFQAKATLRSLVENFPKPDVRDLAREKLKLIEQEELSRKMKSDSTDREK